MFYFNLPVKCFLFIWFTDTDPINQTNIEKNKRRHNFITLHHSDQNLANLCDLWVCVRLLRGEQWMSQRLSLVSPRCNRNVPIAWISEIDMIPTWQKDSEADAWNRTCTTRHTLQSRYHWFDLLWDFNIYNWCFAEQKLSHSPPTQSIYLAYLWTKKKLIEKKSNKFTLILWK